MLILHKFCVKYNPHIALKITQLACYIVHMICVYKIQTTQNTKFLTVHRYENRRRSREKHFCSAFTADSFNITIILNYTL